jgi:adenosylhomocysteine nucleosidase
LSEEQRAASAFVIAATGLRAEARIAARAAKVRAVVGGGDADRLEQLIRQGIREGASGILSFGLAAGLAPHLLPGTCLIGREVVHRTTRHAADTAWTSRLKQAIGHADLVTVAGVDSPLRSPSEKQALYAESGAAVADMESHVVARLATKHGLAFAVLRVVADPAEQPVPPAALAGMRRDGGIAISTVLASLARDPRQLPALIRLVADTLPALAALLRCHDLLGPALGFGNLS